MIALLLACAAERPEGPLRYVLAASGLKLRAAAGKEAAELGQVEYGGEVVLLGSGGADRVAGMDGRWVEVWTAAGRGWAFDGYLGPWSPPEACADLGEEAQQRWAGPEPARMILGKGEPVARFEQWTRPLQGGARLDWTVDPDGGGDELWLPGLSLGQAWHTVRRCVPEPEAARAWGLPTAGKACGEGCTVSVAEGSVRIATERGRACTTRLERVGEGVQVGVWCGVGGLAPLAGAG